jgi:hypothetical protein
MEDTTETYMLLKNEYIKLSTKTDKLNELANIFIKKITYALEQIKLQNIQNNENDENNKNDDMFEMNINNFFENVDDDKSLLNLDIDILQSNIDILLSNYNNLTRDLNSICYLKKKFKINRYLYIKVSELLFKIDGRLDSITGLLTNLYKKETRVDSNDLQNKRKYEEQKEFDEKQKKQKII